MRARLRRGLRRAWARAVLAGAVVASLAAVALWWPHQEPQQPPSSSPDTVRVGVPPGGSIPGYVADSRRRLAAQSPGVGYALVTFDSYLAPTALAGQLDGLEPVQAIIRIPLPRTQTEIVRVPVRRLPDDLLTALDGVAQRKEGEVLGYGRRGDADPALRDTYLDRARVAAAEAAAMRQRVPCVYAVVVRGGVAVLAAAAERPGVRSVDPAPEVTDPWRAVFLPPLPEQSALAGPPAGG